MLRKLLFILRYIHKRLVFFGRLQMDGFVFFERDVSFCLARDARVAIGRRAYFKKGVVIECSGQGSIRIGEQTVIGYYAWIGSVNRVEMGRKCLIGSYVTIFDSAHIIGKGGYIADSGYVTGETLIGDDCMVGTKATVGANVRIGTGAIVGANAVVTHDLGENVIAAGVPARIMGERQ
jgi:acetyltransferase-like isoleucine patch superfamily enzyme